MRLGLSGTRVMKEENDFSDLLAWVIRCRVLLSCGSLALVSEELRFHLSFACPVPPQTCQSIKWQTGSKPREDFAAVAVLDCPQCWPSRERRFTAMEPREKYALVPLGILAETRTWCSAAPLQGWRGRSCCPLGVVLLPAHPASSINLIYSGSSSIL